MVWRWRRWGWERTRLQSSAVLLLVLLSAICISLVYTSTADHTRRRWTHQFKPLPSGKARQQTLGNVTAWHGRHAAQSLSSGLPLVGCKKVIVVVGGTSSGAQFCKCCANSAERAMQHVWSALNAQHNCITVFVSAYVCARACVWPLNCLLLLPSTRSKSWLTSCESATVQERERESERVREWQREVVRRWAPTMNICCCVDSFISRLCAQRQKPNICASVIFICVLTYFIHVSNMLRAINSALK